MQVILLKESQTHSLDKLLAVIANNTSWELDLAEAERRQKSVNASYA